LKVYYPDLIIMIATSEAFGDIS